MGLRFLKRGGAAAAAIAMAATLAACGGSDASSTDSGAAASGGDTTTGKVTIASYGGDYQKAQAEAYWKPFIKANPGFQVTEDSPSDNAKIRAMAESGNVTWDLVLVDDSFGLDSHAKYLEPIDYTNINKADFLPGYAGKYRIGADVEATVLAYNKDKVKNAPAGLKDFFDTQKIPGKRSAWKYVAGGILEAALLADGVPAEQLYPLDVDRALKKLDTIRDDIVWWTEGAQSQQMLSSGETPLGFVWTGRAVDAAETGAPIDIDWTQWLTQNGWWVIPKGSPNKAAAQKLIDYMVSPEAQANMTKYLPYGPPNTKANAKVDPKYKDLLPTNHLDGRIEIDFKWWADNYDAVDKKFQAWLLG
ncbi:MAG: putative spermidine/putrescine transport system substrate-binding protein [Solirubrobacteraceae bacterium]|jgi:putative spermidine/putrescine transport system substrate-binding protein|nr:putative spermidine/putrescine transport system substrate-binding protein [Solirubrobacteraceae bacterium]